MSDKALMSNATLEFTQKAQRHFPRNIADEIIQAWNGVPANEIPRCMPRNDGQIPVY